MLGSSLIKHLKTKRQLTDFTSHVMCFAFTVIREKLFGVSIHRLHIKSDAVLAGTMSGFYQSVEICGC